MNEKEFNKLTAEETNSMLQEIEDNYSNLNLDITKPKYDKEGNWLNEKEVKNSLKLILPILYLLWQRNMAITTAKSIKIMTYTNIYFNTLKKAKNLSKKSISVKEWNNMIDNIVKNRQKAIRIKQVINGNARVLNKRVQNTVVKMYKDGKSWVQTSKELQREFGYNKNKAKSIAITEKNYYKSEAQLQSIDNIQENVKKTWIHTRAKEPRETHLQADGQAADKKGYFNIGGLKTQAPQHFGIPSEDINCHCIMKVEVIE